MAARLGSRAPAGGWAGGARAGRRARRGSSRCARGGSRRARGRAALRSSASSLIRGSTRRHEPLARGRQRRQRARSDSGSTVRSAAIDVAPEADRIVVGGIERHPRERPLLVGRARHSLSRIVFPQPAGAQTRVSFRPSADERRPTRSDRGTKPGRTSGTCSFVETRTCCAGDTAALMARASSPDRSSAPRGSRARARQKSPDARKSPALRGFSISCGASVNRRCI